MDFKAHILMTLWVGWLSLIEATQVPRVLAANSTGNGTSEDPEPQIATPEMKLFGRISGAAFLLLSVVLAVYWSIQNKRMERLAMERRGT